jgi:CDP-diacylglycerol--glycerol-3-phosphate 3-phosphatidyltransferase
MGLWDHVKRGYLRLISPIADWMVARKVNPNTITTLGTLCSMVAGGLFAAGWIMMAGWVLGITALFDVVDGEVARRSRRETVFGAFYDSTLDRVADGALLGGLCIFFARNGVHHRFPVWMSTPMVAVLLLGIIGSFLTSYTRARAQGLGIDAKVGILQRPERIVMLSAPQAFFGLTLHGWVLVLICVLLSVTAWITAVQRIAFVHRATFGRERKPTDAQVSPQRSELADLPDAVDARAAIDTAGRRPNDVASTPRLDVAR